MVIAVFNGTPKEEPLVNHHAMTIRDYLEARYQRPISQARTGRTAALRQNDESFRELLRDKHAEPARETSSGLTVADYLAAAISVHRRIPAEDKPQCDELVLDQDAVRPDRCPTDQSKCRLEGPPSEKLPVEPALTPDRTDKPGNKDHGNANPDGLIDRSVFKAARKYNLNPDLIRAVIRAESNFQVDAKSPAGAQGLMQLMPATARELGVTNSFDIDQNIDGGSRYLRQMLDRYAGDLKMALSAYNAGPGNVDKYGGRVPFAETRQYVDRVLRFSRQMA